MQGDLSKPYKTAGPMTAGQVLESAANIIAERFVNSDIYSDATKAKQFLQFKLNQHEREVFAVMFLTSQHQLIDYQELFFGTIDAASVYPREIVKAALKENAAAVILSHNHPSGETTPSNADISITHRIKDALALVDVTVLDHIIVGKDTTSLAERGQL